jgi:hypothetical protein
MVTMTDPKETPMDPTFEQRVNARARQIALNLAQVEAEKPGLLRRCWLALPRPFRARAEREAVDRLIMADLSATYERKQRGQQ